MLHGRRDDAEDADEADEAEADEVALEAVEATWAAPAGPDAEVKAARTSAAEVTTHHSAFLRPGAFLRLRRLILTSLRTG